MRYVRGQTIVSFGINALQAGQGLIGICPAPGRFGDFEADWTAILAWKPNLVLTMTGQDELTRIGAETFPDKLAEAAIDWVHVPVLDFGTPKAEAREMWPDASKRAQAVLGAEGRVLVHCFGGCGRSGMAILRILVEMGENGPAALTRLREVRPCAVETEAQMQWALRL